MQGVGQGSISVNTWSGLLITNRNDLKMSGRKSWMTVTSSLKNISSP